MWTLLLSRQADPPGMFLDRRQIDSGQIKVGRGAQTCDWVIADTSGQLSREHCTISAMGLDLFVIDTSTNGVSLNDPAQRIAPQMPVAIRVRDRLLLGDYVIEVATESAGAGVALQPAAPAGLPGGAGGGFNQPDQWFDAPNDPVWGVGQNSVEVHEFLGNAMHDFLAPPASPGFGAAPGGTGGDPGWGGPLSDAFSKPILATPAPASLDAFAIPEDWAAPGAAAAPAKASGADPFGGFAPPPPVPPPRVPADPFADFAPPPAARTPDAPADPFAGSSPSARSRPVSAPDPFAGFVSPSAGGLPSSDVDPFAGFAPPSAPADPFAEFAPASSGAIDPFADAPMTPHVDPFADTVPQPSDPFAGFGMDAPRPAAERTQFEPRLPMAEAAMEAVSPAPLDIAPARAEPASEPAGGEAAWAAFCEGAGIAPDELRTSPDAMRRLGVLYRQVVLGLSDLIQDRAAFKNEFRVERTQLSFGRNNPLKHLPALETAKLLLGDPLPGFMPADDAVRSAFEDVKKHQLAMLAGVQHALTAVFDRLSPQEIERVMAKAAGTKRGLPFSRGVNPWTVYQTVFEALRRDATSNVNSVMSVAFREGYEKFLGSRP